LRNHQGGFDAMIGFSLSSPIHLCLQPTDMRKNFDGLTGLVISGLGKDPVRDGAFVFVNKRRDKMKILLWDRHGYWLLYKRLEAGCFQMPPPDTAAKGIDPESLRLTYEQLVMIIEGIDLESVKRRKRYALS
jgi:transposase